LEFQLCYLTVTSRGPRLRVTSTQTSPPESPAHRSRLSLRVAQGKLWSRSRFLYLDQFRPNHKLRADGPVVLIGAAGFGIDPGKAATHGRIIRLCVNGADVLPQEHAATSVNPGSPLPPAGAIDQLRTVRFRNRRGFLVAQGDAVGTTGRSMGAREAWQRGNIAHAQS
jgi:hypothetical protein